MSTPIPNDELGHACFDIAESMACIIELTEGGELIEAGEIHRLLLLLDTIRRVARNTGYVADRIAKSIGETQWRGDADEWVMPYLIKEPTGE